MKNVAKNGDKIYKNYMKGKTCHQRHKKQRGYSCGNIFMTWDFLADTCEIFVYKMKILGVAKIFTEIYDSPKGFAKYVQDGSKKICAWGKIVVWSNF